MDVRALVGRNFARLRAEARLTQEEVAARANVSQQYLSGLERGTRNPSIETLVQIAAALGVGHVALVEPDDVFEESRSMPTAGSDL
ncbi:MAG: helix-turn-helix transcriptional regulator [Rhizobiaceae bacterium]